MTPQRVGSSWTEGEQETTWPLPIFCIQLGSKWASRRVERESNRPPEASEQSEPRDLANRENNRAAWNCSKSWDCAFWLTCWLSVDRRKFYCLLSHHHHLKRTQSPSLSSSIIHHPSSLLPSYSQQLVLSVLPPISTLTCREGHQLDHQPGSHSIPQSITHPPLSL